MDEMNEHVKFTGAFAKTEFAKNLFYQDKKKKKMYLVVAAGSTETDLKAMWKKIGATGGNVRAAGEDVLEEVLGCKKGGVTLFSIVNDVNKEVTLIVDQRLWDHFDYVGFHPMVNTATISISRDDMKKVIEISGHEPTIIDFADMAGGATQAPA